VLKFARSLLDGAVAKKKSAIAPSAIKKAMIVKLFILPPYNPRRFAAYQIDPRSLSRSRFNLKKRSQPS
jgi:hypothetical protein